MVSPAPNHLPPPPLVLVDSSYYITLLRHKQDPLAELQRFENDYDIAINGVIWGEVLRGRTDPHVRDRYERAFNVTQMLHLSPRGWRQVASLAWELDRKGEIIPITDIIIGVTAMEHGAAVLTFDRHFQRIPNLIAVSDLD